MSSGVTCALFGWLNTRYAAAFWIICSGFATQAGRHVRRALQYSRRELTRVCTSSWVAYWVRYGLILRMLNSAKRHDLETDAMWSVKVSWSSIMTQRFLAVFERTRDKESILILMLWWRTCFAGKTISSVFARFSETVRDPRRDRGVLRRERQKQVSIIVITVVGKTMRAGDSAVRRS